MQYESAPHRPQLIEEIEILLGTPFFNNEAAYTIEDFAADDIGFKRFIYRACCRVLAEARTDDREVARAQPNYDPAVRNDGWELAAQSLADVAFRYEERVRFLSRQLAVVNRAEEYAETHWSELQTRLHEYQQTYLLDIVTSLQKPPRTIMLIDEYGDTSPYAIQGTTIIAPTGFGKTRLIEACAVMCGAGKKLEHCARSQEAVRVVLVTPSRTILHQNAVALREVLSDITIGEVHGDKRETAADIVVTTIDMFNALFDDNKLDGNYVDVVMVDEAHHLSEPNFRDTFVRQWRGTSLVFTATPAYNLARDVRKIIPHVVEQTDILDCIDKGLLNDGQIFTMLIGRDEYEMLLQRYGLELDAAQKEAYVREVLDTLVIEFVTPLIEQGRRGIIFCESGARAFYARRLAERLNQVDLSNGGTVQAAAMDSYSNNQHKVIDDYRRGLIHVVTTVDTGREGLDANFDFVIINCNIVSRLRGHQIVGRGTRVSEQFPATIYCQFVNYIFKTPFEELYSIEEAFGGKTILQGRTLRTKNDYRKGPKDYGVDLTIFPDVIYKLLEYMHNKPVAETFVGNSRGSRAVVEGYIPLPRIIEGYHATELYAKKLLRRAGYAWRGRIEVVDSRRQLMHYYSSEAQEYLRATLLKDEALTTAETAVFFGVSKGLIQLLSRDPANGIVVKVASMGRGGRPAFYYDSEALHKLAVVIENMPRPKPGSQRLSSVAQAFGIDSESAWKLSGAPSKCASQFGGVLYLTPTEISNVAAAFEDAPMAEPGEMHLAEMSRRSGIEWKVIERHFTDRERAIAKDKHFIDPRGFICQAPHWPAHESQVIVARMEKFRSRGLPAHLLPSGCLRAFMRNIRVTPRGELMSILESGGFAQEGMMITGSNAMSQCLSWPAIAHLEQTLGRGRGKRSIQIDYSRLPSGPDDLNPQNVAYAQSIQRRFLRAKQLEVYDFDS